MTVHGERDLAMVGSVISLGTLSFLVGGMFARNEFLVLPFIALLAAALITTGATISLASGHPRNAHRFLLMGGGLLLVAAVLNGLPLGVALGIAAAIVWGSAMRLNMKLRRGYYDP